MEDNTKVYVNTFAEGACITEPQEITEDKVRMIARGWKKGFTIAHYKLFGIETVGAGKEKQTLLVGDVGAAKVVLPLDPAISGLKDGQSKTSLLEHWISAVVEDYDFQDEVNPVIVLNRVKALERMCEINAQRVQPGRRVTTVIQGTIHGAYLVNAGGYEAVLPRAFYDWDFDKLGTVGETFQAQVVASKSGVLAVSRRALLTNPMIKAVDRYKSGMTVRAKITHVFNGLYKADISPGVKISIDATNMREITEVGEEVFVVIRKSNPKEFYGVFAV